MSESVSLESQFNRAVTAFEEAVSDGNVVSLDAALAQAAAPEHERRFRELLNALPAAVYTTDAAGRITYYNDAAAALWGYRPRWRWRSRKIVPYAEWRPLASGRTEHACRSSPTRAHSMMRRAN